MSGGFIYTVFVMPIGATYQDPVVIQVKHGFVR